MGVKGRNLAIRTLKTGVLCAVAVLFLLPILVTFMTALRSNPDILKNGLRALPNPVYLSGFISTWTKSSIGLFVRNSFIITIPSVVGATFCASLAAYAISITRFYLRVAILIVFFGGLWFPPQTFLIPVYLLSQKLGIYDTYFGLILVHIAYSLPFGVLTLSRFFGSIPTAIVDAARVEGAGEFGILARIVWPLALPALGAVAIFQFTWIWNDFFWGLVMTQSTHVMPLMVGMTSTLGRYVFDWNGQSVGSVIAMLPPLVIFIFLQRFFIEGVRSGAMK